MGEASPQAEWLNARPSRTCCAYKLTYVQRCAFAETVEYRLTSDSDLACEEKGHKGAAKSENSAVAWWAEREQTQYRCGL